MKLGLLTAALGQMTLPEVAAWASRVGYQALEIAAWPERSPHPHQAAHLDVARFTESSAEQVHVLLGEHNLTISAIAYCENNLHSDDRERRRVHAHLRACIDTAGILGVPYVTTFIGRDPTRSVTDNLRLAEQTLPALTAYGADRHVQLLAENCPMEGWHPDGYPGNLAYSPELWDWMADLGFALTYDPSHLPWLGIDPYDALDHALARHLVAHVQAKDIEIDTDARTRHGIFGKTVTRTSATDVGWWRYRIPGNGLLDWTRIIDRLRTAGYDGSIAVEHEDPVWTGTLGKTQQGLILAAEKLSEVLGSLSHPQPAG
jgi:sugar phosphate isomerase/epimerase